jgi:hypothetical protein
MQIGFDEKDRELLIQREAKRSLLIGPQVGDYVIFPDSLGGGIRQFTHYWQDDLKGDSLQTTVGSHKRADGTVHPCAGDVSFYIDRDGECNFSGSLDKAIPKDKIFPSYNGTNQALRYGNVWFFHHDVPGAHRGVHAMITFKIWEYKP